MNIRTMPHTVMTGARQIALASLGAAAAAGAGRRDLLDELVRRGRTVEAASRRRTAAARRRAQERRAQLRGEVQERLESAVAEVLDRLRVPRRDQVRLLSRRVEDLTARVGELDRELERAAARAFHVVPHRGGWAVTEDGLAEPVATHDTKTAASAAARELARAAAPSRLLLHRADGTVQGSTDYPAAP